MKCYPVKENPIGTTVSEILWYKLTDRHRFTLYYRLIHTALFLDIIVFVFRLLVADGDYFRTENIGYVDINAKGKTFVVHYNLDDSKQ